MSQHLIEQLLENVNGNTIISIDTCTEPQMSGGQANPNRGRIFKLAIGHNVIVFTNKKTNGYEAMVNRRLVQEGFDPSTFKVGPRAWGKRIDGTPFVTHNGETYLEVIFLRAGGVQYTKDGAPISKEEAIACGVKESAGEGHQGGLKNKVVIRTYKMSSIAAMTVNGQRHEF